MKNLKIGFNRLEHKKRKVACPRGCGARVRRDGLSTHYKSRKCVVRPPKYDHKKYCAKKMKCGRCSKLICRSVLKRHKKTKKCISASL